MMKKILLAALAAFTLVGAAQAERVQVIKDLGWLTPNSAVANGANQVSFAPRPLNSESAGLDTTGVFSMMDADFSGMPGAFITDVASGTGLDSVLVGYIVLYSDSSADGASTCTAVTATIEASGDGNDWCTVATAAGIAASDDPVVPIMLCTRPSLDHQMLLTTAPRLRIRFTTVTGILVAAKCRLIYWSTVRAGS